MFAQSDHNLCWAQSGYSTPSHPTPPHPASPHPTYPLSGAFISDWLFSFVILQAGCRRAFVMVVVLGILGLFWNYRGLRGPSNQTQLSLLPLESGHKRSKSHLDESPAVDVTEPAMPPILIDFKRKKLAERQRLGKPRPHSLSYSTASGYNFSEQDLDLMKLVSSKTLPLCTRIYP